MGFRWVNLDHFGLFQRQAQRFKNLIVPSTFNSINFQNPFKYIATNIMLQNCHFVSHFVSKVSTSSSQFDFSFAQPCIDLVTGEGMHATTMLLP